MRARSIFRRAAGRRTRRSRRERARVPSSASTAPRRCRGWSRTSARRSRTSMQPGDSCRAARLLAAGLSKPVVAGRWERPPEPCAGGPRTRLSRPAHRAARPQGRRLRLRDAARATAQPQREGSPRRRHRTGPLRGSAQLWRPAPTAWFPGSSAPARLAQGATASSSRPRTAGLSAWRRLWLPRPIGPRPGQPSARRPPLPTRRTQ
jgi:hypothetical protein